MKFSIAVTAVSAALTAKVRPADATNFLVIQPDDMAYYESWSPPPHHPWGPDADDYPGTDYPSGSSLPWINKLRNEGMHLTQAYAASPKCGTSRYSTVTGRYASRAATARRTSWKKQAHPLDASIPTTKLENVGKVRDGRDCSDNNVAQVLSKNNYATGMVGKWHLTNTESGDSMTSLKSIVAGCGFLDTEAMYPDNIIENSMQAWSNNGDGSIHHNMEYVAYKAVEFIDQNKANDWFLYVNPTVPHGPSVEEAMEVDCRLTTDGDFTGGDDWSVVGMTAEFGNNCTAYREDVKRRAGTSLSDDDLGSIWVDDAIGAIYKELNRTNQLDDTFILFQLDHGKVKKDQIWEGGIRIPQFVHWPNGGLPSSFDGLVSTIDIAPTMLEIANLVSGATPPPVDLYDMDGRSWLGAARGLDPAWADRCLFFESSFDRAVRCGCDKYMRLTPGSTELGDAVGAGYEGYDALTTEVLVDLCDGSNSYVDASMAEESPEAVNVKDQQPLKVVDLAALMDCHLTRTDARLANETDPSFAECQGSVATPVPTISPKPTLHPTPALPVANNSGIAMILEDTFPWHEDLVQPNANFKLSAVVLDDDIDQVRFMIRYPDGSTEGFDNTTVGTMLLPTNGDESTHEFEIDTTASGHGSGVYGFRVEMADKTRDNSRVRYPESGFVEFVVAEDVAELVALAREAISDIITQGFPQVNLAAKFVRHGFHDCVGGCDGCVDMNNGDNAGLDVPIAALEPVVDLFAHHPVTRADIWVLAALEGVYATQEAGSTANKEFTMDWIGRPTCEDLNDPCVGGVCAQDAGPHRELPSPSLDTAGMLAYFDAEFGFSDRDTVAIMGAHTLGVLARNNSGYDGENGWLPNSNQFDNAYYNNLVGGTDADYAAGDTVAYEEDVTQWDQVFVDNSALSTPDRWEWERVDNMGNHFVMVNSDMALVRNFDGFLNNETGRVDGCAFKCNRRLQNVQNACNWNGGAPDKPSACPAATGLIEIAADYKFDNAMFISEFESAFKRMLTRGCDACGTCLSPPCVMGASGRRNLRGGN